MPVTWKLTRSGAAVLPVREIRKFPAVGPVSEAVAAVAVTLTVLVSSSRMV